MVNRHRGEILAVLDGKDYTLCLTLGTLAELEMHFEAENLLNLAERICGTALSASDMLAIVCAGFKGGGYDFTEQEIGEMRTENSAAGYAEIVVDLLEATFGSTSSDEANSK